ncbi:hypothetical protein KFE25_012775 [Diacronema lutheri]|uniref:Uncharacterized protein n=1 Tax=Diacronema lutheri TaxID=2081491 RepID=A0A8J5X806_DIALT|nr:hypothetical protein KFE25_012775 [Diacronema lutheri]
MPGRASLTEVRGVPTAEEDAEAAEATSFKRHHWQHLPEKLLAIRVRERRRALAKAAEPVPCSPARLATPELECARLELHALDMAFGKGGWIVERRHAAIEYETCDEDTGLWVVGVSVVVRLRGASAGGGTHHHHDDVAFAWSRRRDRQLARDEALAFAGRKAHKRLCSYLYGVLPKELVDRARTSQLHAARPSVKS